MEKNAIVIIVWNLYVFRSVLAFLVAFLNQSLLKLLDTHSLSNSIALQVELFSHELLKI